MPCSIGLKAVKLLVCSLWQYFCQTAERLKFDSCFHNTSDL